MINAKHGVGALFICPTTNRVLMNLRSPHKSHGLCWSLWGGMIENGESPSTALHREMSEELGKVPDIQKIYPFDIYESRDKSFRYYTFICIVDSEFIPVLNDEAVGYAWTEVGIWPRPLHYGARKSLTSKNALDKINLIVGQHRQ